MALLDALELRPFAAPGVVARPRVAVRPAVAAAWPGVVARLGVAVRPAVAVRLHVAARPDVAARPAAAARRVQLGPNAPPALLCCFGRASVPEHLRSTGSPTLRFPALQSASTRF